MKNQVLFCSEELFEAFYDVVKAYGFKFSNYCDSSTFHHEPTSLLWDLMIASPEFTVEKYLDKEQGVFNVRNSVYGSLLDDDEVEIEVQLFMKAYDRLMMVINKSKFH